MCLCAGALRAVADGGAVRGERVRAAHSQRRTFGAAVAGARRRVRVEAPARDHRHRRLGRTPARPRPPRHRNRQQLRRRLPHRRNHRPLHALQPLTTTPFLAPSFLNLSLDSD